MASLLARSPSHSTGTGGGYRWLQVLEDVVIEEVDADLEGALRVGAHDPVGAQRAQDGAQQAVECPHDGGPHLPVRKVCVDGLLVLANELIGRIAPGGLDWLTLQACLGRRARRVAHRVQQPLGIALVVDPRVGHAPCGRRRRP